MSSPQKPLLDTMSDADFLVLVNQNPDSQSTMSSPHKPLLDTMSDADFLVKDPTNDKQMIFEKFIRVFAVYMSSTAHFECMVSMWFLNYLA